MLRAGCAFVLAVLVALPAGAAGPPPVEQWLVVTAPLFRESLEPLIRHRRDQGLRVVVLRTTDVLTAREVTSGEVGKLRDRVRQLCQGHPGPSSVLLVGAVGAGLSPRPEQILVPPLKGAVGRMKNEPSDAGYGCPDDKGLPRVAVGRFPARTEAEVKAMVARTLALERATAPGAWKRRLTVLAGIPAYNAVVDRLVEGLAFARFDRIDPAWTGRAVYTNPLSRFSLPEKQLRTQSLAYLREGQAFTLYLGHSNAEGLYAGPTAAFLDRTDWSRLTMPHGGGVFITFGCNGCQLKGSGGEGYGVWAMRNPSGPAAVIGSHGICFAAMVQLGADGLFRRAFQGPLPRRLGDCWLAVLEGLARGKIDFLTYRMLDAVDGDPRIPQATQRAEHLEMFVLLGDPALRLPQVPASVRLDGPGWVTPGKTLVVRGTLPPSLHGATVQLTLERLPGSTPAELLPVPSQPGAERDRIMRDNHVRANRFVLVEASAQARGADFEGKLEVPTKLSWARVVLRAYAATRREEGMAARLLPTATP